MTSICENSGIKKIIGIKFAYKSSQCFTIRTNCEILEFIFIERLMNRNFIFENLSPFLTGMFDFKCWKAEMRKGKFYYYMTLLNNFFLSVCLHMSREFSAYSLLVCVPVNKILYWQTYIIYPRKVAWNCTVVFGLNFSQNTMGPLSAKIPFLSRNI